MSARRSRRGVRPRHPPVRHFPTTRSAVGCQAAPCHHCARQIHAYAQSAWQVAVSARSSLAHAADVPAFVYALPALVIPSAARGPSTSSSGRHRPFGVTSRPARTARGRPRPHGGASWIRLPAASIGVPSPSYDQGRHRVSLAALTPIATSSATRRDTERPASPSIRSGHHRPRPAWRSPQALLLRSLRHGRVRWR
jgi:hypothetical protein